jgi:hypothetical protein
LFHQRWKFCYYAYAYMYGYGREYFLLNPKSLYLYVLLRRKVHILVRPPKVE